MTAPQPNGSSSIVSDQESWIGIVDDDASLRFALALALRLNGFRVEAFASAEDFLLRSITGRPDCLILDVHLGGLSGLELQDRLTQDGAPVPIIFMTAHDDAATRERIRRSGAAGYLGKPFDGQALLDAIQRVVGSGAAPPAPRG